MQLGHSNQNLISKLESNSEDKGQGINDACVYSFAYTSILSNKVKWQQREESPGG
jgi:hypothetical protein